MPDEYFMKICIMGAARELKTRMVRTFAGEKFTTDYLPTLGIDITTKQIRVNNNKVKLALVDALEQPSYQGASAAIITFDKGDRNSFKAAKDFYMEVKRHLKPNKTKSLLIMRRHPRLFPEEEVEEYESSDVVIPIFLIGFITNSEEITTLEGQNLAEELKFFYYETKLTDKETIAKIFEDLAARVLAIKTGQT
ncbi:MAG: hypothetical protein ACFFB5_23415 [Promethearchaeota archaeon]